MKLKKHTFGYDVTGMSLSYRRVGNYVHLPPLCCRKEQEIKISVMGKNMSFINQSFKNVILFGLNAKIPGCLSAFFHGFGI